VQRSEKPDAPTARTILKILGMIFHSIRSCSTTSEFCASAPDRILTARLHFCNLAGLPGLPAQNGATRNTGERS